MQNSIAAGKRLAKHVVAVQLGVTILLATGFLLQGWRSSLAALSGGGAVVLSTIALALRFLHGASANVVLMRLIGGVALKWTVFLVIVYITLVTFALPPLPLLTSVVITTLAVLLCGKTKDVKVHL